MIAHGGTGSVHRGERDGDKNGVRPVGMIEPGPLPDIPWVL